ncbi:HDOD domain-containing protein [Agaribacterium haliotis]|uniref:HDOD domain-containing protein n=1 Tax=Agaribacterium haliotis TaxID=2013869 RepID=UPI000BB54572|nr:HDOD domain-containing protein [Agaribacterium haliotis]
MSAKMKRWVASLKSKSMPVLGSVISELNKITESDESSAAQLAEVILRDPNLTSQVLRVANSVQFNYSQQQINTISRAIVLIGLKGVRAICISLLVLDRMLAGENKQQVLKLVAQGFHAAVQAEALVSERGRGNDAEEVFIAALLFNLGEMAFWLAERKPEQHQALLSGDPLQRKHAQKDLLGGSFKELTIELAQHWKLGETLTAALEARPERMPENKKVAAVITGERLSRASLFGWESPQFRKVLAEVAQMQGIAIEQALRDVKAAADRAAEIAVSYGAVDVCPMIPSSVQSTYFAERSPSSKVLKPDTKLQLSVLRELSAAAAEQAHVNTIFQMLLEGLHRGVGLERVAIAFIKGTKATVRYAVGESTERWRENLRFDADPYSENIFTYAMEQGEALWFGLDLVDARAELYTPALQEYLGKLPCFVYTVRIADKPRAFIYADRAFFGGVLNDEQYEAFRHFCGQARLCLNSLAHVR